MGRKGDGRLFAFVDHTTSVGVRAITSRTGVNDDTARDVMRDILHEVCTAWGRQSLYIPAALEVGRTDRDDRIWTAYGGPAAEGSLWGGTKPFSHERLAAIAKAEKLSQRQVYNIVANVRRRLRSGVKPPGTFPDRGSADAAVEREKDGMTS